MYTTCIYNLYQQSFIANVYSTTHFRMIGLIDVNIQYTYGIERVTLAFYSSSGTNNGKIKGLWYPIVGIKQHTGRFVEFTDRINAILTETSFNGEAKRGWLAKSPFFYNNAKEMGRLEGFSNGRHYETLLEIGTYLRDAYEKGHYHKMNNLNARLLNEKVTSEVIYLGNQHTQKENFENFISDIFNNL